MKTIKSVIFIAMVILSSTANAGSYQGYITNVFAHSGKIFILVKNGTFGNSTTCTGFTDRLSLWIDPSTDYGKALISISLTAKSSNKLVWVTGSTTCITGPLGNSEQLSAIDLKG